MVKIALQFCANLENVTELKPAGDDFLWNFKMKCANCGEVPNHWQNFSATQQHPLKGGRGTANCVIKCKLCSRENSIDIVEHTLTPYSNSDSNKFKNLIVFDCRGIEPVDFDPRDGWTCKGFVQEEGEDEEDEGRESGTVFEDVDLSEGDWADYDEKSDNSVCISEIKHDFVKIK